MRIVGDAGELDAAWAAEYRRLAREVACRFPRRPVEVLELGCGDGRFTGALARERPDARFTAIDRFVGPYAHARTAIRGRLAAGGLSERVRVVAGDAVDEMRRWPAHRFDAVVSSELLPEITSADLATVFRGCLRRLHRGGVSAHVFLSPIARTEGQRLTIAADSDPRWSRHPPAEWFSPPPGLARTRLVDAGFSAVRLRRLPSRLRFTGAAARRQLRRWGVRPTFGRLLGRSANLELPDWVILSGRKPGRPGAPTRTTGRSAYLVRK